MVKYLPLLSAISFSNMTVEMLSYYFEFVISKIVQI